MYNLLSDFKSDFISCNNFHIFFNMGGNRYINQEMCVQGSWQEQDIVFQSVSYFFLYVSNLEHIMQPCNWIAFPGELATWGDICLMLWFNSDTGASQ